MIGRRSERGEIGILSMGMIDFGSVFGRNKEIESVIEIMRRIEIDY